MSSQLESALAELRAARPEASPELRERVRMLSRLEPAPRRTLFPRRAVLALVAAALVGSVVAVGIVQRDDRGEQQAGESFAGKEGASEGFATPESAPTVASDAARLQDFRAELRVRVDDVGRKTAEAMRIAQTLGGYVVSAQYGGAKTDSLLVVRVPISRAQDAIGRFSRLGTLAAQRFSLQDLQAAVDQVDDQVQSLQARIAELEEQLRDPRLSRQERVVLRSQLDQARQELTFVLDQREATVEQARFAEITLTLTAAAEPEPESQGVIGDAVDALGSIWIWVLAVLIVGAPFLALLVAAVLLARRLRRRANERLLGS